MKRVFDVVVATMALILLAPILALIACVIWASERGQVIYRGVRVGRAGREFRIIKFRTMRSDALITRQLTVADDPRLTRLGRFLRATKLDELPQLINVICGEMSLVGPRPESPSYVAHYTPEQLAVLSVRPGITGPSQIAFPHEEKMLRGPDPEGFYIAAVMPTKLAIDLDYLRHRSFWLDLKILALTMIAMFHTVAPAPGQLMSELGPALVPVSASAIGQDGRMSGTRDARARHGLVVTLRHQGLFAAFDVLVVAAAYETAGVLRFIDSPRVLAELGGLLAPCFVTGLLYSVLSYLFRLHRRWWRYANIRDALALLGVVALTALLIGVLDLASQQLGLGVARGLRPLPLSVVLGGACLSFLFLGGAKVLPKMLLLHQATHVVADGLDTTRVLIVGAGDAGVTLAARFAVNHAHGYRVMGFVDDDPAKLRRSVYGIRVLGPISLVPLLATQLRIDLIAIAMPSAPASRISQIIAICQQTTASIKIWPGLDEVVGQRQQGVQLREVNVADLLGREVVPLRASEIDCFLEAKTVLVTGAAGSIGSELCRQLVSSSPRNVIALDNNETGLFELAASLTSQSARERLRLQIGDITDRAGMSRLMAVHRPDVIFHAAAYKHVPLLEQHPVQAVRINVLGTYDLCRLASTWGVGVFVFISSDKAAEPVNVLGATKRIGELIVQSLGLCEESSTRFCAVRFGNVIGSRGSVVPTFVRQIEHGGPVTVTDPEATRYFMTVAEACGLVVFIATIPDSGGVYLLDMGKPVRIAELAAKLIRSRGLRVERDIPIVYTGLRPGERIHEVLIGPGETLVPSSHFGILRVSDESDGPGLAAVENWIHAMQEWCERDDPPALRQRLLELTCEKKAV